MISNDGIDRARSFISSNNWIFAKTYAETAPHEYVVKDNLADEAMKAEFEWFVMFIRDSGYQAEFWDKAYTYLDIDAKKYWTMGEPLEETIILNRAEIEDSKNKNPEGDR